MTYITPDALAIRQEIRDPWSIRGMVEARRQRGVIDQNQPILPSVPMPPVALQRRYLKKAPVARFPLDGAWRDYGEGGMGSLGDDPLVVAMEQIIAQMKKNLMAQTAAVAAITVSLNFVPGIGTIVSGIFALVSGLTGAALRREGERKLADFQDEMMRAGAQFQLQVDEAHSQAFDQEKPAAIQLALSNTTLGQLDGILSKVLSSDSFKAIVNPIRQVKTLYVAPIINAVKTVTNVTQKLPIIGHTAEDVGQAASRVDTQTERPVAAVDTAVDTITGVKGLKDIENAIADGRINILTQMSAATQDTIAKLNSPAYRALLRTNMAKAIRSSQPLQAFQKGMIISDAQSTDVPKLSPVPMAVAAGGAVLLLLGLSK